MDNNLHKLIKAYESQPSMRERVKERILDDKIRYEIQSKAEERARMWETFQERKKKLKEHLTRGMRETNEGAKK